MILFLLFLPFLRQRYRNSVVFAFLPARKINVFTSVEKQNPKNEFLMKIRYAPAV